MDGIDIPSWAPGLATWAGLATTTLWLILSGRLIPRRTLDDLIASAEARVKAAEGRERVAMAGWQEATAQVATLMGSARTTERVLSALPPAIGAEDLT